MGLLLVACSILAGHILMGLIVGRYYEVRSRWVGRSPDDFYYTGMIIFGYFSFVGLLIYLVWKVFERFCRPDIWWKRITGFSKWMQYVVIENPANILLKFVRRVEGRD